MMPGKRKASRFAKKENAVETPPIIHLQNSDGNDDYMDNSLIPVETQISCSKKQKSMKELMETSRNEKLQLPIDKSNVGFKLLQKFGFSDNDRGLGKDGKGIKEPLPLFERSVPKSSGIGVDEIHRQKRQKVAQLAEESKNRSDREKSKMKKDFVISKSTFHNLIRVKKDLSRAKMSIRDLDTKQGISWNELWPKTSCQQEDKDVGDAIADEPAERETNEDDSVETEKDDPIENLYQCLSYLRETYSYCYYCGCHYNDLSDMNDHCPGLDYDDH